MPKRFVDSEVFKSPSIRALKAPYKLLWLYLVNDCDNAGVWVVDFDIAAIYLDRKYKAEEALKEMGDKVTVIDGGKRWYLPDFVSFQYGELNPENRAHKSVIDKLEKFKISPNKPLTRPSQGRKDKDKDKDKEETREKAEEIYEAYPRKVAKPAAIKAIAAAMKSGKSYDHLISKTKAFAAAVAKWPEEDRQFIPHGATWFNRGGYDEPASEWERNTNQPTAVNDPPEPSPFPTNWKPVMMTHLHDNEPHLVERFQGINSPNDLPFTLRKAIFGR